MYTVHFLYHVIQCSNRPHSQPPSPQSSSAVGAPMKGNDGTFHHGREHDTDNDGCRSRLGDDHENYNQSSIYNAWSSCHVMTAIAIDKAAVGRP